MYFILDYSLGLRFGDVMSEENTWSQSVFLVVEENLTVQKLNIFLMKSFDMEPGFQAPCRKPHLSLLYGHFPDKSKEEAHRIVRNDFEKDIFQTVFQMGTVELWNTGGGLEGVPKWNHVGDIAL